jgi:Rrf2 family nitric oxide-sensitive transcriptional repressor
VRLTTFTDYSLRVLIHVATAPGGRTTIAEVASAYGISESHLVKIVHVLGRGGILETARGRGGGFALALPPDAINVGAVVRVTEGIDLPAECFDPEKNTCVISRVCRLSGVLNDAMRAFYAVLDGYTIADLVRDRAPLVAILHRQRADLRKPA